jgi:uncharacterized protein YcbK (DUF882 family)
MGNITEHFTREEFLCHCPRRHDVQPISLTLIDGLESLRAKLDRPVIVLSGYRCLAHNKEIGGEQHSQHLSGTAADIRVSGIGTKELYELAETTDPFTEGGVGIYPDEGFIHVDVRGYRARWGRVNDKYGSAQEALKSCAQTAIETPPREI